MNEISSLNTSFYSELVEGFAPKSTLPVQALSRETGNNNSSYSYPAEQKEEFSENVDLSNYYNQVRQPEDLLTKSGQYLAQAGKTLDNTMVIAMQNGYSIQDVCNIKLAEQAYKASAYVFDIAEEISTFELDV